ncbi:MAG: hypothetical protein IPJ27_01170 [Candidatus Accumulibacter sp.]|uniref:Acyltransferase n=1 Tax=Candidatus Accumulibacter proximus TaxID=2954385 RepID=A0A935UE20_9PROT|nr:hypothetical protein [Candidatus Accumulibacter proximus]
MEPYLGRFGAELFFMISGFLIFMSLSKVRSGFKGLQDFAIARFSRLYPASWAVMCVTFLIALLFGLPGRSVEISDLPANATMLPSILRTPMVDEVYRTLEKELFFYFWMAAPLLAGALKNLRSILLMWMLLSATALPVATAIG